MSLNGAAVGPVDVAAFLTERASGVKVPRTKSVEVFLSPELAEEYDQLVDEFNELVEADRAAAKLEASIGDGPGSHDAELDALEARMEAVKVEVESSKVRLTFRSYRPGDQVAINNAMLAEGFSPERDPEELYVFGTAQYSVDPVLTVEQVRELVEAIGFAQFNDVRLCWEDLVYGRPTGPKSRRPLLSRGTETL